MDQEYDLDELLSIICAHLVKAVKREIEREPTHRPLILRGVQAVEVDLSYQMRKRFNLVYRALPKPKLDALVRLFVDTAYDENKDPKWVADALGCSLYKAKELLKRFGYENC